ncbi:hypothetical protein HDF26_004452 [Pedobacter cryoconitis]|uniref:Uncharacterized protein n=1 Tax=Pedobacter cryoconitis TaxID=188932 RepID=A0A7W8ZNE3_9SPHI|nr:hypothetical protein [Pedobacter cryoconitis]MBB5637219.1 hypothetical protein [Pedobacter cryoconitis]MBB6273979.1 hypothetical protein [Pedobacter cryoconitis]
MVLQSGTVLWVFDYEFPEFTLLEKIGMLFSGVNPLHKHSGTVYLTQDQLRLAAQDDELIIPLRDITQLYMGFDEIYKVTYVKSMGTFWQPVRIVYDQGNETKTVYLVIDLNYLSSGNNQWFGMLKEMLS